MFEKDIIIKVLLFASRHFQLKFCLFQGKKNVLRKCILRYEICVYTWRHSRLTHISSLPALYLDKWRKRFSKNAYRVCIICFEWIWFFFHPFIHKWCPGIFFLNLLFWFLVFSFVVCCWWGWYIVLVVH